jgi:SAM-dependent methyltransferase
MLSRFRGTQRYLAAHGPAFFGRVGAGFLLSASLLLLALTIDQWGLVLIALAVLFLVMYFALSCLWAIYLRFDKGESAPDQIIIRLGGIAAGDMITMIDLGERRLAIDLSRHLSTGRITVADIYNPQIFDRPYIKRWRQILPVAVEDRRLIWSVGTFNLLPIQDSCQDAVILFGVLSELVQDGDRKLLLGEVYRILRPGGRIIVAEPISSLTNRLLMGWGASHFKPVNHWLRMLDRANYLRLKKIKINDVIVYIRGEKLELMQGIQLTLLRD